MPSSKLIIATVRGTLQQRERFKQAARESGASMNEFILRCVEAAMSSKKSKIKKSLASGESDCCPMTAEADCQRCSGEYCDVHFDRPCDCDVLQRHGLGDNDLRTD